MCAYKGSFFIMGRGKGKGKKRTAIAAREDPGSGEEGKSPGYRRRGRPQKPLKDEIEEEAEEEEEEVAEKIEEDGENSKCNISRKDVKNPATIENGRKRKRSAQVKESIDSVGVENGIGTKSSPNDSIKSVGFRQNGSRRKNKPRRAAEAGVECK
ncbi:uncharacterized protein LOC121268343 isoform X1 [Juglans microcarpa x Juglans regia]|uniref:uncharacterized protein LOC121268343 isoform X1 n=2 Tax=Juglans microcarpa x Juglans regia TaxID=2249226 RepID=UPI001B7DE4B6|nr:uncharacterized protein LOC121268343 isoform X1 [Juglans microcarpa x Juglans regia]